jgi:diguanylate cyclase (GGDEF)-like protein
MSPATPRSATDNAEFDTLTELPNRRGLIARLGRLLEITRRTRSRLALLYVDLDRFNDINDSMGHDAGNALLQIVARRIEGAVRKSDMVARVGADEFAVLVPELRHTTDVASIASKLLAAIGAPITLQDRTLAVSASIGICVSPDGGADPEDLVRNAVAAMVKAKRVRRNTYEFYAPEMTAHAAEKLRMENELRLALERDELVLHYQPQIDLAAGRVVGAEALLRWNKPGLGLVMPGEFLPLAEERGLMPLVGRWVIQRALRQLQAWADRPELAPIVISVNVTANEFYRPEFVEHLERDVREHGVTPSRLELELTESIAVQDAASTAKILAALHAHGVRLSLDDFGTGYSSLSHLRHLPIDTIKIDGSFVRELSHGPDALRLVLAIVGLARGFGMKVIAEGVENEDQLAALRAAGCDGAQGCLLGPARPPERFEQLVAQWRPAAKPALGQLPRADGTELARDGSGHVIE